MYVFAELDTKTAEYAFVIVAEIVPIYIDSPGYVYSIVLADIDCGSEKKTRVVPEATDKTPDWPPRYGSYRMSDCASVSGSEMLNLTKTPAVAIDNASPFTCGWGFAECCQL